MSIGGGVHMAIERGCSINCTAIQMFVKNNMQWFARPLRRQEIRAFCDHVQRGDLLSIFAHANYLINLAAANPQFLANSIRALSEELTRADQLELPFLVLHPGAHLGAGEEAGPRLAGGSTSAHWQRPNRSRCVSLHHARSPIWQNPESSRNAEGQGTAGRRDQPKDVARIAVAAAVSAATSNAPPGRAASTIN